MVERVTLLVPNVVGPTDKRIDLFKEFIELARLKDRPML